MVNGGKLQIRLIGFLRSCLAPQEATASKVNLDVATRNWLMPGGEADGAHLGANNTWQQPRLSTMSNRWNLSYFHKKQL